MGFRGGAETIIRQDGVLKANRKALNFIGATVADDSAEDEAEITIVESAMVRIFHSKLAAAASSINIPNIPNTYTHLLLLLQLRSADQTGAGLDALMRVNGSNAGYRTIQGSALVGTSGSWTVLLDVLAQSDAPAGAFSVARVDLYDYADAAAKQHMQFQSGVSQYNELGDGAGGYVGIGSWDTLTAVDRIEVFPSVGTLAIGSSATLYGLD